METGALVASWAVSHGATMFLSFRKSWAALRRSHPGHRFQASYERHQKSRQHRSLWARAAVPIIGAGIFVVGLVLLVIPGPGLPFVGVGGALLARESRSVALALDRVEVKVRTLLRPLIQGWQKYRAAGH
jgi:hypothetical protein